jgi:hypothetical protein
MENHLKRAFNMLDMAGTGGLTEEGIIDVRIVSLFVNFTF